MDTQEEKQINNTMNCKHSYIKTDLYSAKPISSNFTNEVTVIRNKLESAGYPKGFVNTIN